MLDGNDQVNAGAGTEIILGRSGAATRLMTAGAGGLLLGAVAVALGGGRSALAIALAMVGIVLAVTALAPGTLAAVRRNRAWLFFAALLLLLGWEGLTTIHRVGSTEVVRVVPSVPEYIGHISTQSVLGRLPLLAVVALLALGGLVLVSDGVRVWLGLAPLQRAPWRQMTEQLPTPRGIAWRGVSGLVLTALAAILAIGFASSYAARNPALQVAAVMLVAGGALCIVGTPVAIGALMRVDRDKAGTARELERQRFAAHLHDSVLQTLALVQRQAHDPVAVARLARRQEYALRAWMAGEAELRSETVAAALREVVSEVEDEHRLTIELTAIGDRALDGTGEALVAAAREALRNAARHAEGSAVYVFAELSTEGGEVFVRDEGPGFVADAVPAERRGIRDAIIGRMASAGGSANVESTPGEGTEVALRIPGRSAR